LARPEEYSWTCASCCPPKSTAQRANRSVQPFLQNSLLWQTDRPRYSVGINRPHLCT